MLMMRPAATALHVRDGEAAAAHGPHQLQVDVGLPGLVAHGLEPARRRLTRVVDEDVEPAELRDGGRDEGLDVRHAAHVRHLREDLPARRLPDAVGGLLQPLLAATADRDARALAREPLRGGPPEPVAAPGDDGYLAVQSEIEHAVLLLLSV
jgi:hypothetical protein